MKEAIIKVKGMHCHSCEMLIEDSLEELGVQNVKSSFNDGTVKIKYDETRIKQQDISKAIENEGYRVERWIQ